MVVVLEPLVPDFWQVPVHVPGEPRRVGAVVAKNFGKHCVVVRVEVEPFLRGVTWYVR